MGRGCRVPGLRRGAADRVPRRQYRRALLALRRGARTRRGAKRRGGARMHGGGFPAAVLGERAAADALEPARRVDRGACNRRRGRVLARRLAADGPLRRALRRGDPVRAFGDADRGARQPVSRSAAALAGLSVPLCRGASAVVDGRRVCSRRHRHLQPARGGNRSRGADRRLVLCLGRAAAAARGSPARQAADLAGDPSRRTGAGARARLRSLPAARPGEPRRNALPALRSGAGPAQAGFAAPHGGADRGGAGALSGGADHSDDQVGASPGD